MTKGLTTATALWRTIASTGLLVLLPVGAAVHANTSDAIGSAIQPSAAQASASTTAPSDKDAQTRAVETLRWQLSDFFTAEDSGPVRVRMPGEPPLSAPGEASVQLELRRLPARLKDCSAPQLSLNAARSDRHTPGLKRLQLLCANGQQHIISVRMERYAWRLSTPQLLASGTPLAPARLTPVLTALGKLRGNGFESAAALSGFEVRRRLRAGEVITRNSVRAIPLVNFGDTVTYQVNGTGFSMQRSARALEAGGLDERIRIELAPGDWVRARVIGPRRVAP
ncbi:flagellar basal body P-ring formation chaperone FlgA [Cobetia sp. MB87]|uniref:flagellar basal body P-ring formation chaperone FlgA n=1 Tax=Cobetia sp. MB87 TaxID=2588451 RepID=UPI00140D02B0